jgi:hypothetical protein
LNRNGFTRNKEDSWRESKDPSVNRTMSRQLKLAAGPVGIPRFGAW